MPFASPGAPSLRSFLVDVRPLSRLHHRCRFSRPEDLGHYRVDQGLAQGKGVERLRFWDFRQDEQTSQPRGLCRRYPARYV